MSIKLGEVGRLLYVGTTFDMSSYTELVIKFTSPSGYTFTRATADGVTAPATDSPALSASGDFSGGVLPANTYMLYETVAGDFDEGGPGEWTICVRYEDASPKIYYGDDTILIIEDGC